MGTVDKAVREEFQKEVEGLQKKQKEIQKCVQAREKLEAQLTENKVVKEELDLLESSSNIYKLTGPVLVKQDLEESKETVSKRINYISAEIKRQETAISGLEKDQDKHKENLAKLQTKLSAPARA